MIWDEIQVLGLVAKRSSGVLEGDSGIGYGCEEKFY